MFYFMLRSARPSVGKQNSQPVEMSPLNPKSAVRAREFPMNSVRFLQELGEGAFGKVYKGELVGLYGESSVTKVAVKTLKENALPKVQNDFRREVSPSSYLFFKLILKITLLLPNFCFFLV